MADIQTVIDNSAYADHARQQGANVIVWPDNKGGGFVVGIDGVSVLVNCEDEHWCKLWGKMATVRSFDDVDGLLESLRGRVEGA